MLPQLSAAVRVFLCTRPTDLRKGFDGRLMGRDWCLEGRGCPISAALRSPGTDLAP